MENKLQFILIYQFVEIKFIKLLAKNADNLFSAGLRPAEAYCYNRGCFFSPEYDRWPYQNSGHTEGSFFFTRILKKKHLLEKKHPLKKKPILKRKYLLKKKHILKKKHLLEKKHTKRNILWKRNTFWKLLYFLK